MKHKPQGAAAPHTSFPKFQIGALHIPIQRIEMDSDALKLQSAILVSADDIRSRWNRTRNKAAYASRMAAVVAYLAGAAVALVWLVGKVVS